MKTKPQNIIRIFISKKNILRMVLGKLEASTGIK